MFYLLDRHIQHTVSHSAKGLEWPQQPVRLLCKKLHKQRHKHLQGVAHQSASRSCSRTTLYPKVKQTTAANKANGSTIMTEESEAGTTTHRVCFNFHTTAILSLHYSLGVFFGKFHSYWKGQNIHDMTKPAPTLTQTNQQQVL